MFEDYLRGYGAPIRESNRTIQASNGLFNLHSSLFVEGCASPSESEAKIFQVKAMRGDGDSKEIVGYLQGALLRRPDKRFFIVADCISAELQELSVLFCNSRGIAKRVGHPRLNDSSAVEQGGFLDIAKIELHNDVRGHDLGLWLIHEALVFLQNEWTLAVLIPGFLHANERKWYKEGDFMSGIHVNSLEEWDTQLLSLKKHYTRMGFVQAGRTTRLAGAFFVTSDWYFQQSLTTNATERWLTKEEAAGIDIFVTPRKQQPTGVDLELIHEIDRGIGSLLCSQLDADDLKGIVNKIKDLVRRRGASIDGTKAMHFCAAHLPGIGLPILQALIELGGDVDYRDEKNSTPLHFAAAKMNLTVIECLVAAGAKIYCADIDGETPVQALKHTMNERKDRDALSAGVYVNFIIPDNESPVAQKALLLLSPPSAKSMLVDGWLSPRMKQMLMETAIVIANRLRLEDAYWKALRYLPPSLPREVIVSFPFTEGFSQCFRVIARLLRDDQVPTVERVKTAVSRIKSFAGEGHYGRVMMEAGGKVEHALDALFATAEQVLDDGENVIREYVMFRPEIEAFPPTPFDDTFDLGFFQCVNQGGGEPIQRGPHRFPKGERILRYSM